MSSEKPTSPFVPGKLLFVWVGYVVCMVGNGDRHEIWQFENEESSWIWKSAYVGKQWGMKPQRWDFFGKLGSKVKRQFLRSFEDIHLTVIWPFWHVIRYTYLCKITAQCRSWQMEVLLSVGMVEIWIWNGNNFMYLQVLMLITLE
jgi:hypothetical protein